MSPRSLLFVAAFSVACIGDMVAEPVREVVDGYGLRRFEEGASFMLTRLPVPLRRAEGDVTRGFVQRLGYSPEAVVALVVSSEGMKSGWWVLYAGRRDVVGPISEDELRTRIASEPKLGRIVVRDVAEAWAALGHSNEQS